MKKVTRVVISSALVASMMMSITSCDKAGKQCIEVGDEFMGALIDRDAEDMAELCTDEDEAQAIFAVYCGDNEAVEAVLSRATFEAGKPSCKTKDKKGEIEYTITLPDYESCLDEDPEDVDEFEDLLDDTKDTVEMKVTLEFKLKKDDWLIDNAEEIAEEIYQELYDVDWGFESEFASKISSYRFFASDDGVYSSDTSYLDLDIYFSEDISDRLSFDVIYNGSVVYSDTESASDYAYLYCHDYDMAGGSFSSGEYIFNVYDSSGALLLTDTCVVN